MTNNYNITAGINGKFSRTKHHLVFLELTSSGTPERFKANINDIFATNPSSYLTLLSSLSTLLQTHHSSSPSQDLESTIEIFHSTISLAESLISELSDLQLSQSNIKALYISHPVKELKNTEITQAEGSKKEEIEKNLSEATTVLQAALAGLQCLCKSDLTEISSFRNPPAVVKTVLEMLSTLMGQGGDYKSMLVYLKKANFLSELMNFDKDRIPQKSVNSIKLRIRENPNLTHDHVKAVSKACAGLFSFITGMLAYHDIKQKITPLIEEFKTAQNESFEPKTKKVEEFKERHRDEETNRELSKALAPVIEREAEVKSEIAKLNEKVAELELLRNILRNEIIYKKI